MRTAARLGAAVLLFTLALVLACDAAPSVPAPPRIDLGQADPRVAKLISDLLARVEADPTNAELRGELGMAYEAHAVNRAALQCYLQAAALDQHNPRWPYFAALLQARQGQLDLALDNLVRAMRLDESYVPAHVYRGTWLLDLDRLDEASAVFQRAIALEPDGIAATVGMARVHLKRGAGTEAVMVLQPLALRSPQDPYLQQLLGLAHRQAGQLELAEAALARARNSREPRWPDPWHDRIATFETGYGALMGNAEALLASNQNQAALAILEALQVERPSDEALLNNLSIAYRRTGQTERAFETLQQGLEWHPDYFAFHLNISSDYAARGDLTRALEHLDRASTLNPNIARPFVMKGQLLTKVRDYPAALEAFESALAHEPREPTALLHGGVLAIQLGLLDQAVNRLERAVEAAPAQFRASLALSTAQARLGNFTAAEAALEQAIASGAAVNQVDSARSAIEKARSTPR